ncbi:MAG: hypothetical protein E6J14_13205 [Chloroflexi bacterium]|nr:MAG: hypothetical protein E6J14_13205 [Chloroflexota bacterium]
MSDQDRERSLTERAQRRWWSRLQRRIWRTDRLKPDGATASRAAAVATRWVLRPEALVLLVYVALAVGLGWGAWKAPRSSWIGDFGDPKQTIWFLRWTEFSVFHGHNPLTTSYINFPDGVNLMWNTWVPLPGLLLAPITAAFGPLAAYNVLVTLGRALAGWFMYLALRRYVKTHRAALLGGAVYAFSPYMLAQGHGHAHMLLALTPPLVLIALDEIFVRQRLRAATIGAGLGLLAVAQFFIAEEVLASEILVATLGLAILAALRPHEVRGRVEYASRAVGWSLCVLLVGVVWPVAVQFLGPQRIQGAVHPPDVFVSDLVGFIVPSNALQFAPNAVSDINSHLSGGPDDSVAYLGLPLLLFLAFVAGRLWSSLLIRAASLLAIVVAVLSLGPHLHIDGHVTDFPLPWQIVDKMPVVNNLTPVRLMLYVYLLAAVLLAAFVDTVVTSRRGDLAAALALTFVLLPLYPKLPYTTTTADIPSFFSGSEVDRIPADSVALVVPGGWDAMLWQAAAGMRFQMPGGYFIAPSDAAGDSTLGPVPSPLFDAIDRVQHPGATPSVSDAVNRAILQDLRSRQVHTVVVGPMGQQDAEVALFTSVLGRPPQSVADVYVWWNVS